MNFLEIVATVVFIKVAVILLGTGVHYFKLATNEDYKAYEKMKKEAKKKLNIVIEKLNLVQSKNEFYDIIFDPYKKGSFDSSSLIDESKNDDFDNENNIVNLICNSMITWQNEELKKCFSDVKSKNIESDRINDYINCFNLIDKEVDAEFDILEIKRLIKLELIKNNYTRNQEF